MSMMSMLQTVSGLAGLTGRFGFDSRAGAQGGAAGLPFYRTSTMMDKLSGSGLVLSEESVEEIKDSFEIGQSLQRAAERMDDGSRSQKIQEIKQKIELLKQRLQFASPDQARELQRELKQLAKDFKQAASDLSSSGAGLAPTGITPASIQAGEGAEGAAVDVVAEAGVVAATTVPSEASAGGDSGQGGDGQTSVAVPGGTSDADGAADGAGDPSQEEHKAALRAYVGDQMLEEAGITRARAQAMKEEGEILKEVAEELKRLGKRIDTLARRDQQDDEERRSQASAINRTIADGLAELRDPRFVQGLNTALSGGALPEGVAPATTGPASPADAAQASVAYTGGPVASLGLGASVSFAASIVV